jgi:lipopolysaccharide export LptBFGC system permease protein LptF
MYKKKSLSPLIATILLIVVSVILITVVLTWGSSFAKENLNKATSTVDFKESDLSSFLTITNILQLSENNVITIRNLHSKEPITFIGYKLITKENYVFANQRLYFDEVITLEPGAIT